MLLSLLLVLQVEEVSDLHAARAYEHLPLQSYQETCLLLKRLTLLVVEFCIPEVIAKVGIGTDTAFPEVTEQLHFLLGHVTMRHYVHIERLCFDGWIFTTLLLFIACNFLDEFLDEETDTNSHGHLRGLIVCNLVVETASYRQGLKAGEKLPAGCRLHSTRRHL